MMTTTKKQVFKPILFSTAMVQAILEGRKTQTRRIIKLPVTESAIWGGGAYIEHKSGERTAVDSESNLPSPIKKGDILWVRETWTEGSDSFPYVHKAGYPDYIPGNIENIPPIDKMKWKPSIFMPKAACRFFLEVTNVRLERLQDISEEDIVDEGIFLDEDYLPKKTKWTSELVMARAVKKEWKSLWQKINGPKSWDANPWVWVYDFKRIEKPQNFLS